MTKVTPSWPHHDEQHPEAGDGSQCVRPVCRHQDDFATGKLETLPVDHDLRFSLQNVHQRIEGSCVFAETLAFIEGEKCDRAGLPTKNRTAPVW